MTAKNRSLTSGPSREELFDCLRLHASNDLCIVDFWETTIEEKSKSGSRLDVEIQGLHEAGDCGREWFFWGQLKLAGSGPTWKPFKEAPYGAFVFGRWNTYHRRGRIQYSKQSFFTVPLFEE